MKIIPAAHASFRIYTPDTEHYGWIGSKQYRTWNQANMSLHGADRSASRVVAVEATANAKRERVRIAPLLVNVEPDLVTDGDIESLYAEAHAAGDLDMMDLITLSKRGDSAARKKVDAVIIDNRRNVFLESEAP